MFTNGECGIWLNASACCGGIKEQAKFSFGQTLLHCEPHSGRRLDG